MKRHDKLLKKLNRAVGDFNLIERGDRIAAAYSGGKDSAALLKLLMIKRDAGDIPFDLGVLHVEPEPDGKTEELERFLNGLDIEYGIESPDIPEAVNESPCFLCSRRRREALFKAADRLGFNKIAFGHNMDDAAQTALINLFFQAKMESMEPVVSFFGGKVTVIRPLYYIEERRIAGFVESENLPLFDSPCPYSRDSVRDRIKSILDDLDGDYKSVKANIISAMTGMR